MIEVRRGLKKIADYLTHWQSLRKAEYLCVLVLLTPVFGHYPQVAALSSVPCILVVESPTVRGSRQTKWKVSELAGGDVTLRWCVGGGSGAAGIKLC